MTPHLSSDETKQAMLEFVLHASIAGGQCRGFMGPPDNYRAVNTFSILFLKLINGQPGTALTCALTWLKPVLH
jgi:hypothetical protein